MITWSQLDVDKAHVAYAIVAVCSMVFAVFSLFIKEKLYLGEATISAIAGVIVGPHCLGWFNPLTWSENSNYLIQEISRVVLIIQIFAVSVELPPKYMKLHWKSMSILLFFGMTFGWLITALFIYIIFHRLNFADALLISGCVTLTDPVLAAAIVGSGKFGDRVPAHMKNLLSAESGANDGMAFPFVLLATQLVVRYGHAREIVKEWILVSILYECVFGPLLGIIIGYTGRQLIKFCERKNLIDRESFLVFYILLSLICTGFGSILGVDDLLVAFAAGAAFAWDGWFQRKTIDSNLSSIVDLLLNMSYFLFFGAIIPWGDYNDKNLGLDAWRLVLIGIIVIFLRRIPIFLIMKPFTPELRSWREALYCGHFGPIGVGGIFCSMIAISSVEGYYTSIDTPTASWSAEHAYVIRVLWPIVTFMAVTSIIVHGSSLPFIILTNHVSHMKFFVRRPRSIGADETLATNEEEEEEASSSLQHLKKRLTHRSVSGTVSADDAIEQISVKFDEDGKIRKPEFVYMQGKTTIVEDQNGEVLDEFIYDPDSSTDEQNTWFTALKNSWKSQCVDTNVDEKNRKRKRALNMQTLNAFQSGNEIFIENEDGEIIRRYIIDRKSDEENQNQNLNLTPTRSRVNNHHTSVYDELEIRDGLKSFGNAE